MTEAKPAKFAQGDKVTSKDGRKLVVIGQASPGSAVHAESAEPATKDRPYVNTFYAADSLRKGHGRAAAQSTSTEPDESQGDDTQGDAGDGQDD